MHLLWTLSFLSVVVSARALQSQQAIQGILAQGSSSPEDLGYRIPTIHESAVQARRILRLEDLGTLTTIFPKNTADSESPISVEERRPADVAGTPVGLVDYFADCEPLTGNPTILAISIATSFKNVDAGSNISLALRWHPLDGQNKKYSAASLPRFNLVGYLEKISDFEVKEKGIASCFGQYHPDARLWMPGNRIHTSEWTRLVVQEIYWIGGFGDRAYIGWIPRNEWTNVTNEEIERIRLPGE